MESKEMKGTKNTKDRLDELQDLLQAGYLTENEYRVARINTLREEGVDIVIHARAPDAKHRPDLEEEEDEEKSGGCGCFLASAFLIVVVALGAVLAVPKWPENFGGFYAQTARQWILDRGAELFALFSSDEPDPAPDPGPSVILPATVVVVGNEEDARQEPTFPALSSDLPFDFSSNLSFDLPLFELSLSERTGELSSDVFPGRAPTSPLPPAPETASYAEPVLPPLDARIFSLPDISNLNSPSLSNSQEPDVTIIEVSSSPSSSASTFQRSEIGQGRRGVVSGRSVRIRSAPDTSTNDNVVGWGANGDRFRVLEEGTARDGSAWYRIRYEVGGKQGWISGSLVTLEE
jgi:hypothetical protein